MAQQLGDWEKLNHWKRCAATTRSAAATDVVKCFPRRGLPMGTTLYRLRKGIPWELQGDPNQYDSPPAVHAPAGRLESSGFPVLYGSQDRQKRSFDREAGPRAQSAGEGYA